MKKTQLTERFQELAGINKLSVLKEAEVTEQFKNRINENPMLKEELFTALAGLAGILVSAGVTGQIQAAMEDPAIADKYPAMAKIFSVLQKIGGDVTPGMGKGVTENGWV
tara:strand:- start:602 stop:931 length:330 start_codon:yes stop_codon:yes gene_type:complete